MTGAVSGAMADQVRVSASAGALAARLLEDYERGARFERDDARDVLLRLDEDAFPDAFRPDGREVMDALTADIEALERAGALRVVRQRMRGGGERVELRMGPSQVPQAYAAACPHGYQPLRVRLDALIDVVTRLTPTYSNGGDAPRWWSDYLVLVSEGAGQGDLRAIGISTRARLKSEWVEVRDALIAANALACGVDAWARHVSERLFADSKRLTSISARVAAILRAADPRWTDLPDTPEPADVLAAYGIRRRPPTITCAGTVPITRPSEMRAGRVYHLGDFEPVAVLPSAWASDLAAAAVAAGIRTVTTIENEYPLFSYVEEAGGPAGLGARGELVIWSGGYVAVHLLDLLAKIAEASENPEGGQGVAFRHWGDADPDGLGIWWQIRSTLGRPVSLFRTTADWVREAAGRDGQPLTEADRRLLAAHIARFRRAAGDDLRPGKVPSDLLEAARLAEALLAFGMKIEQERQ